MPLVSRLVLVPEKSVGPVRLEPNVHSLVGVFEVVEEVGTVEVDGRSSVKESPLLVRAARARGGGGRRGGADGLHRNESLVFLCSA